MREDPEDQEEPKREQDLPAQFRDAKRVPDRF